MTMEDVDIERLAALAGIALEAGELDALGDELTEIAGYIGRLEEADTDAVEPVVQPVPGELLDSDGRDDEVTGGVDGDVLMGNAPAVEDGQFRVPSVGAGADAGNLEERDGDE